MLKRFCETSQEKQNLAGRTFNIGSEAITAYLEQKLLRYTKLIGMIAGIKNSEKRSRSVLENVNSAQGNVLGLILVMWPSKRYWKLWYPFQLLRQHNVERIVDDFLLRKDSKLRASDQQLDWISVTILIHESSDSEHSNCYWSWTVIGQAEDNNLTS